MVQTYTGRTNGKLFRKVQVEIPEFLTMAVKMTEDDMVQVPCLFEQRHSYKRSNKKNTFLLCSWSLKAGLQRAYWRIIGI
jgi:hypothetical protein